MYDIGIVADDLTGVLDTGHGFAERGHQTVIITTPTASGRHSTPSSGGVVGYNTDSRYVETAEAVRRVSDAVGTIPSPRIYKKVDSTLRGNVCAELDAALRASEASCCVFAPAYPQQGRTTSDGIHYVDGEPVDATTYAADEKGPSTAVLVDLFAGLDRPIRSLPLESVSREPEQIRGEIEAIVEDAQEPPIIVVDAVKTGHLQRIAESLRSLDVLVAGSGGLAKHLRIPGAAAGAPVVSVSNDGGPLAIVGSVNPAMLAQLRQVPDEAVFVLAPSKLVEQTVPQEMVERVVERLLAGRPVVLTAATDRSDVERTLAIGEREDLAASTVRDRVATTLGGIGVTATEAAPISGILLTGGELALATLEESGGTRISLSGSSVDDGMPIGRIDDGALASNPVVTKAGGFGGRNALRDYLERFGRT